MTTVGRLDAYEQLSPQAGYCDRGPVGCLGGVHRIGVHPVMERAVSKGTGCQRREGERRGMGNRFGMWATGSQPPTDRGIL